MATLTILLNNDAIEEYFASHRYIRSQVIAAAYPAISHERTTIKFLIGGFSNARTSFPSSHTEHPNLPARCSIYNL